MKVSVSIVSTIKDEDERQTTSQTANGFLRVCDNSLELSYREAAGDEGLGNTLTSLRIFDDHLELSRRGDYQCLLVLETGVKHECDYATPFGVLTLTTDTMSYHSSLTKEGRGEIKVCYTLCAANSLTEHTLRVRVEPV